MATDNKWSIGMIHYSKNDQNGPEYTKRLYDNANAPSHAAELVKDSINSLGWEVLPHSPYSPDLASSDYLLFS